MSANHHPNRGSMAYSPRKRARSETPHVGSWPSDDSAEPRLQGFAGYKVGMTHAISIDYRKKSTTAGQEVRMPVTVVEVPPMKVAGVRGYTRTAYGLQTLSEVWAEKLEEDLARRLPLPAGQDRTARWKQLEDGDLEEIRLLVHTLPRRVRGLPKKKPELMEVAVKGGDLPAQLAFAHEKLGTEVTITDFTEAGEILDTLAVTTGKGFQGHVKRWGVKLLTHKNSKHRRMIGNLGPFSPGYVVSTVPQAGQTGYHQRTEFNKRLLKIDDRPEEINPKGGFLHYGEVSNTYALFHGSLPGPAKRLIRLRRATRFHGKAADRVVAPKIVTISRESAQGV